MDERLSVLVCSCDSYSDIWDPFFQLMDKYWKDCPYNVFLNTEHIKYNKQFKNFSVNSINLPGEAIKKKFSWSQRMLLTLEKIESEYLFILIEDFFLREEVQTELLSALMDRMDADQSIGQIQLFGVRTNCDNEQNNTKSNNIRIQQIGDDSAKVAFVPTIWRKSVLVKWMRPWETIWAFESCGSSRARRWKYPEIVYRVYSPAIFNYLWEKGCYCVVNGKWMMHPLLEELFSTNGISIDYSKRGTITMEEWQNVSLSTIIKRQSVWDIFKKCFNRFRSLF